MVMPHIIGQSWLIIYLHRHRLTEIRAGVFGLCVLGLLSAGCGERDAPATIEAPELIRPTTQADSKADAQESDAVLITQADTLAGEGAIGGAMRLSEEVSVIYGIEYADGQAVMSAVTVLRGAPGWQDRANRSTAGKVARSRKLTHVGIGASAGSHSAVFDPATKQLWIDDNQVMPLRRNNVVVFQVPDQPDQPLVLIGQERIDPALGAVPAQGHTKVLQQRLRAKLVEFVL